LVAGFQGPEFPPDPDVSSQAAYPPSYNLQTEHGRYFGRFKDFYSGNGIFPVPLFLSIPRTKLVVFKMPDLSKAKLSTLLPNMFERRFQLSDFYDINEPGEYQLTVWPKIYERSSTNRDVCQRIDLPPLTTKFTLEGK